MFHKIFLAAKERNLVNLLTTFSPHTQLHLYLQINGKKINYKKIDRLQPEKIAYNLIYQYIIMS